MKLALIFNPFRYKAHEENIKIVQKYFGLFPPLSLAWVASIAEHAGHEVKLIDARTLNLSKHQTLNILKTFKPDMLGFMMTTYMFRDTLEWIKYLRKYLNIPVVVGGYNLRVYPKESLMHPEIDFGIVEHAYFTLPSLLKEIEQGTHDYLSVPGLVFKKGKEIIITSHPKKIDFDEFPNPARHLLPNDLYAEFPTERKNFTVMVTSLGCPHQCRFCEAGRTPYNPRSPQTVLSEIKECYNEYGIREFDIFDYEFTGIRERTLEICKLIQAENLDITWACRSRIDSVDKDLLLEMKKAGCNRIYFGIESGDQKILNNINKGLTLDKIKATIDICHSLKIRTLGFFMIGAPGDTKKTVRKTLAFAKSLNLDYAQFSKCLAKPLTPLWDELVNANGYDYWKAWVLGKIEDKDLPRPWTILTNDEINKLTRQAYLSYYLRPSLLWKHLINLNSFSELKRKFLALWDMIFKQEPISRPCNDFKAFNENNKRKINENIKKTSFTDSKK